MTEVTDCYTCGWAKIEEEELLAGLRERVWCDHPRVPPEDSDDAVGAAVDSGRCIRHKRREEERPSTIPDGGHVASHCDQCGGEISLPPGQNPADGLGRHVYGHALQVQFYCRACLPRYPRGRWSRPRWVGDLTGPPPPVTRAEAEAEAAAEARAEDEAPYLGLPVSVATRLRASRERPPGPTATVALTGQQVCDLLVRAHGMQEEALEAQLRQAKASGTTTVTVDAGAARAALGATLSAGLHGTPEWLTALRAVFGGWA